MKAKALSAGLASAIRASAASTASTGDSSRCRIRAASSIAERYSGTASVMATSLAPAKQLASGGSESLYGFRGQRTRRHLAKGVDAPMQVDTHMLRDRHGAADALRHPLDPLSAEE